MSARLQVLVAAVLFGTTGTAQALGPDSSTPLTVGASRIVIGGAILACIAIATGGWKGTWPWRLVVIAGLGVAVYQLAFFEAVARTGVGVGAVVAIGSGPVFAGILERIALGVWPGRRWGAATATAIAGVAVLTLASGSGSALAVDGIALALVSGLGYASYTVVAKLILRRGHTPLAVVGASFGLGAILLLPVLLVGDTAWLRTPDGLALALYLGILPTAIAYVLFAGGLQRLSAAEVTTLVLAEPIVALVLGIAVLDEHIGVAGVIGSALILAGLAMLARREATARLEVVT